MVWYRMVWSSISQYIIVIYIYICKVGKIGKCYYDTLLARFGMGEGERANTSAGSRA